MGEAVIPADKPEGLSAQKRGCMGRSFNSSGESAPTRLFLRFCRFASVPPRTNKKAPTSICIISGKIEISHHDFRGGFLICRNQRKAPHEAGQKIIPQAMFQFLFVVRLCTHKQ